MTAIIATSAYTLPAFDVSVRGFPWEYRNPVWYGETGMVWRKKNFEDMFIRFDMIHERDRQTDGRTDRRTPHDGYSRVYA